MLRRHTLLSSARRRNAGPVPTFIGGGVGVTTTAGVDSTGANFAVVVGSYYTDAPSFSDNKGNSYTRLNIYVNYAWRIVIGYAFGITAGSGHTITATPADFCGIYSGFFSGISTSSPFDVENGGNGSGSPVNTGSITPSQAHTLIIAAINQSDTGTGISIDSGFTIISQRNRDGSAQGGGMAYKIMTAATATNPAFTISGSPTSSAAAIASFKY